MSTSGRPRWLTEECPAWCVAAHAEDDHPHDRHHLGTPLALAGTALRTGATGSGRGSEPGADRAEGVELVLQLHRRVGAAETWLYVGDGFEQRLELTAESAERLLPLLRQALDQSRR